MVKDSWLEGGSPAGSQGWPGPLQGEVHVSNAAQAGSCSPLPCLPPAITAWLLAHMLSLDRRTQVKRPHGPGDFDP